MSKVKDIYDYLNLRFPFDTQEKWDNSGLLCGSFDADVSRCVVSLDADLYSLQFAGQNGAQLLLAHHPIIFDPLKRIEYNSPIWKAVNLGISVIACHTPLDKGSGGTNDVICSLLGLHDITISDDGFIRLGSTEKETTVKEVAAKTADVLDADVGYILPDRIVRRIAVCTGAGGDEYPAAIEMNADCLLTGETKYHELLDAKDHGFPIITAGHFETEQPAMAVLCEELKKQFPDVYFILSEPKNRTFLIKRRSYGA